ncbi:MAG: FAD-dependent oxidoreductase [Acidobacteriota bacterium]
MDPDVIIVGGGPAGISSLVWCNDLRLNAVLLERRNELGGQLLHIHNQIDNYLGVPAPDGRSLRDKFISNIDPRLLRKVLTVEVKSIDFREKKVSFSDGGELPWRSLIIATGLRRRKLGAPGEDEFIGRGILNSGAGEKDSVTGRSVVVVGGGDAAMENAVMLSEVANRVTVVHRRDTFSARPSFVEAALARPNVDFLTNAKVTAIVGTGRLEEIVVDLQDGSRRSIAAHFLLVRIGFSPNSELIQNQAAVDDSGYIIVDSKCMTDLSNVYAVGDVANPISPTISSATGMGATAAKAVLDCLSRNRVK